MKTEWHKYLIYCSLAFLAIALYKAHYLEIPRIHSPAFLFLATVCLVGGFIANIIAQRRLLEKHGFHISMRQAFIMEGLNIFSKYIPGKLWMIMGKAVYLAELKNYRKGELSVLFLHVHVIALWCGLVMGIFGLWMNDALYMLSWIGLLILGFFTLILLSKTVYQTTLNVANKILKRDYNLPEVGFVKTVSLIPWFLGVWLLWGGGFYLLALSITKDTLPLSTIFCFPLASTIGILVIFAPGGIGIREGVIAGYLTLLNVPLPEAVTISAASRLWYLVGEILCFITGYIANQKGFSGNRSPGS